MNRRNFLQTAALGASNLAVAEPAKLPATAPLRITRIRFYHNPASRPLFNQSAHIVTVETDAGITGIGEGGMAETVEQCGAMIIGEDASQIETLWQMMYRGYFYPAGREKLDALGAIDMALWDIKGKALGVPVYEMLGGMARDHVECYATGFPSQGSVKETARACIQAGFRAYRTSVVDGVPFDSHKVVRETARHCEQVREGVGSDGDWSIDYHTRLDLPDAIRLSTLLEPLEPYFCEDLVRSENKAVYHELRRQVKVPIAVGEQFGDKWDTNELIEQRLIDYTRVTLPNSGGITEYRKIAAACETHYVGLIPHFTGPVATAALVHVCGAFPGPVMMETTERGPKAQAHLPECVDFKDGKLYPNRRPGLGVTLDTKPLQLTAEVTKQFRLTPIFRRPDGSITNW